MQKIVFIRNRESLQFQFENSDQLIAAPFPVQNVTVTDALNKQATVSWDALTTSFDNYRVYYENLSTGDDPVIAVNNTSNLTETITGLNDRDTYNFWVVAVRDSIESTEFTKVEDTIVDTIAPGPAANLVLDNSGDVSIVATWDPSASTDIDYYSVELDSVEVAQVQAGDTLTYTASGLTDAQTYQIDIIAVDLSGNVSTAIFDTAEAVDRAAPDAPVLLTVVGEDGEAQLTWQANTEPDLAGYNVYVDGVKDNGPLVVGETYTVTGLTDLQTYEFKITAVDSTRGNESDFSNIINETIADTLAPAAVTGFAIGTAEDGVITTSWNANSEPDLSVYVLYLDGVEVDTTVGLSYNFTGLNDRQEYTVGITARDTSGNESTIVELTDTVVDTIAPAAPTGLAATTISNSQIDLSWDANAESDIKGYNVYIDTVKVTPTPIVGTSYSATSLSPATSYDFNVTAVDLSDNESVQSGTVTQSTVDTVAPAQPTGLTLTPDDQILDASWDANSEPDLAGYNIYLDGIQDNVGLITGTTYQFTGLTNGQTYTVELSAVDNSGNESTKASDTAIPTAFDPSTDIVGIQHIQNTPNTSTNNEIVTGVEHIVDAPNTSTNNELVTGVEHLVANTEETTSPADPAWTVSFDGTDDYITTPHDPAYNTGAFTTLEVSAVFASLGVENKYLFSRYDAVASDGIRLWINTSQQVVVTIDGIDYTSTDTVTTLDALVGIAITLDNNVLTIYIDGVADSGGTQNASTPTTITSPVIFGARQDTTSTLDDYSAQEIAYVRKHSVALSAGTISAYNNKLYNTPLPTATAVWQLEEGTGTTSSEAIQANTATLTNGPTWVDLNATVISTADLASMEFDGVNQYLSMGNLTFSNTNSWTFEFNIYYEGDDGYVFSQGNSVDPDPLFAIRLVSGQPRFTFRPDTGGTLEEVIATTTFTSGNWYHLAVTYDGTLSIYIDGTLENSGTISDIAGRGTYDVSSIAALLRAADAQWTRCFIDEVRIWSDVRTSTEISDNQTSSVDPASANLVNYWKMDEVVGGVVADEVGSNDATLVNSPNLTGFNPITPVLYFDGSNDNVRITHDTSINAGLATDVYSIEMLVFIVGTQSINSLLIKELTSGNDYPMYIFSQYDSGRGEHDIRPFLRIGGSAVGFPTNSGNGVAPNTWVKIKCIWDRTADTIEVLIDDVSAGTVDTSSLTGDATNAQDIYIGEQPSGANSFDSFMFMKYFKMVLNGSTVAEYLVDEGTGTTLTDQSAEANNGTITGATWE